MRQVKNFPSGKMVWIADAQPATIDKAARVLEHTGPLFGDPGRHVAELAELAEAAKFSPIAGTYTPACGREPWHEEVKAIVKVSTGRFNVYAIQHGRQPGWPSQPQIGDIQRA